MATLQRRCENGYLAEAVCEWLLGGGVRMAT